MQASASAGAAQSKLWLAAQEGNTDAVSRLLAALSLSVDYQHGDVFNGAFGVAIRNEHHEVVQAFLEMKADFSSRFWDDKLPLAVAANSPSVVPLLVAAKVSLNKQDEKGSTALHYAAVKDNVEVVGFLLEAKADPAATDKEQLTPLQVSSSAGVAPVLLAAKASVNHRGSGSETALHWASSMDNGLFVRVLVDAKADLEAVRTTGSRGCTALGLAAASGINAMRVLIEAKASVNVCVDFRSPLSWAVHKSNLPGVAKLLQHNVSPPLVQDAFVACCMDGPWSKDIAKLLLRAKADVNAHEHQGASLLARVCRRNSTDVVDALLGAGAADVHNSLLVAAEYGSNLIVELLLGAGANPSHVDRGWSPLFCALNGDKTTFHNGGRVEGNYAHCVELLLNAKARLVDVTPPEGGSWYDEDMPVLHNAVSRSSLAVEDVVRGATRDINCRDKLGGTALHLAAGKGIFTSVWKLLRSKADVNARDSDDQTPLHKAALHGNAGVVRLLLRDKASTDSADKDGKMPYQLVSQDNYEVLQLLKEKILEEHETKRARKQL